MAHEPNAHARRSPQQDGGNAPASDTGRTIGVLINHPLESEYVRAIEAMDSRVRVLSMYRPAEDDTWAEAKQRQAGNSRDGLQEVSSEELDVLIREAEVFFGFNFPIDWIERAANLRWVQLASAGSDHMQREGIFDKHPDLLLTTSSGVHEVPISEHIVAMILHFSRGFNMAVRNQPQHKWERYLPDEALNRTVCMVGYGPIARRAANLCKALGMRVLAVRASLLEQQPGFEAVERFYPLEDLNEALSQSDYVVVAAPRTERSERMIGRDQLAAMKPDAVIINISRGALIDEPALIEALQQGKITGAGLDVFAQEPLPESSPLWDLPNVLVTPHNAGANPHYNSRITELFRANLARYLNGEPLTNLVQRERGY
jgi:phosphoglycerate dehydrogenase-like enzyme